MVSAAGPLKAKCEGTGIAYTLDEPTQGSVAAVLTLGSQRYCMQFGGTVSQDEGAVPGSGDKGAFKAKAVPAPADCVTP